MTFHPFTAVLLQREELNDPDTPDVVTAPLVAEPERTLAMELPEVLEQIFENLSNSDLVHCLTVCKAWFEPSARKIWVHLSVKNWSHPSVVQFGHKYAHHIQDLYCGPGASLAPFTNATQSNLRLRIFQPPLLTSDNMEQALATVTRIKGTVEDLTLKFAHVNDDLHEAFLATIQQLQKLKSLVLHKARVQHELFERFLEQAPKTLEYLSYEGCWVTTGSMQSYERLTPETPTNNLKHLRVTGPQHGFDTVLSITRYTPLLESLVLSDKMQPYFDVRARNQSLREFKRLLPVQCPLLTDLTMVTLATVDREGFKLLLEAVPNIRCDRRSRAAVAYRGVGSCSGAHLD